MLSTMMGLSTVVRSVGSGRSGIFTGVLARSDNIGSFIATVGSISDFHGRIGQIVRSGGGTDGIPEVVQGLGEDADSQAEHGAENDEDLHG
jgi:hypothetical protein